MDFEKYTDRARGFVHSAQSLAMREGHQQMASQHLLKVLLDDPEGLAAGLIDRSGGRSREALFAVEAALTKRPKVEGGGVGQLYLETALARVFDTAEKAAEKARDSFVTVEYMLLAIALASARWQVSPSNRLKSPPNPSQVNACNSRRSSLRWSFIPHPNSQRSAILLRKPHEQAITSSPEGFL